ncbi:MAG: dienelactone hydrolase family protein [Solirubrobacteraceae bacterium]
MAEKRHDETHREEVLESQAGLRGRVAELVGFCVPSVPPGLEVVETRLRHGYHERLVHYSSKTGESIPALLLFPEGDGPFPAVAAYHQHHSQWHLGKSEVAGLAGDPLQGFGPALAKQGVAVLSPDTVGFEDRRPSATGTAPRDDDEQHYDEMARRLLDEGQLLMSTVLADAAQAVSALQGIEGVADDRIGVVGHSMGGSTALFHAALDERVHFACASGAAATYRAKMAAGTGIEASLVIPGIGDVADIDAIASLIAPRPLLLLSATEDPYSQGAERVAEHLREVYESLGARDALQHARFSGGHALTQERVDVILEWVRAQA